MNNVLDASAILALLLDEPGAARIEAVLGSGCVSAVNVAEVITKLMDKGFQRQQALGLWSGLGATVVDYTAEQAIETGLLRTATAEAGLSLGDRACLTLAARLGATALTTDRAWTRVQLGIAIELVR